ncbi:hypothetical protein BG011_000766 [Mortierella polycephala]|uniref:DUF6589 domain-containing protein n=1 Tax=Mortierella polycephala TaxID=41804 RepID=A0A9P6TVM3_9FUNG|nr:hypothetical protein BG011_000766 [Mortierella polycephala]
MAKHQISLRSLLSALFDSTDSEVNSYANRFYKNDGPSVLVGIWAARLSTQQFKTLAEAAADVVVNHGRTELKRMTQIPELRHPANAIQLDKVEDFTLAFIQKHFGPLIFRVMTGLATGNQLKEPSSTVVMICSVLLFLQSQKSNHFQMMMGLYLYSAGCPSGIADVLSQAGISTSRSSILEALKGMTAAALTKVRKEILEKPWFIVYDNINFPSRKSDQRIDNTDTFENGTTATVVICDAFPSAGNIKASYEMLCLDDLIPDKSSLKCLETVSKHILVDVLGRSCTTYQDCLKSVPAINPLAVSKTTTYPLPSMHIDQSSVVGNMEVIDTIIKDVLKLAPEWFESELRVVVAGDQLTVQRVSTLKHLKEIDNSVYNRLEWALPVLQLFHLQMLLCATILRTHYGSTKEPGSLLYNKTLLGRKHISLTDFDYHAGDELLRHTFDAMVRRIWQVEMGIKDLDAAGKDLDDNEIRELVASKAEIRELVASKAEILCEKYVVTSQHRRSSFSPANRNATLFLRHMTIYIELCAGIKAGDIGRIEESLKWITVMFQAGSTKNYANELLHIHCGLRYVWTPEMKRAIMASWLVNTKGKEDGWIPSDLYQEHNNLLTKTIYAARGSNSSWDSLATTISTNIRTFSTIKKQFEKEFNRPRNSSKHSTVSAEKDIERIVVSLRENDILGHNLCAEGRTEVHVALADDLFVTGIKKLATDRITAFKTVGSLPEQKPEQNPDRPITFDQLFGSATDTAV